MTANHRTQIVNYVNESVLAITKDFKLTARQMRTLQLELASLMSSAYRMGQEVSSTH